MSADEIRLKAQKRESKSRLEALFAIAVGLFLGALFARTFARAGELLPRIGWGMLRLWGIYFAYQSYKWIWPGRLAPDATENTSLEFYRSELEKRRDYGLHVWRRAGLTFCFLGFAMIVVPVLIKSINAPSLLLDIAPFLVLLVTWVGAFLYTRKRNQHKLQQEIDELRVFERENRS